MRAIVVFLAMWLLSAGAALAEERFALVVGNQSYSGALSRLNNPGADAQRIEQALNTTRFQSPGIRHDLNRGQIYAEVRALADRLKRAGPDAIGFFYYSGHGASVSLDGRRRNYLIPVGATASKADDLLAEGVPLDEIVAILGATRAKAVFIVFDACRNELPWAKGSDDPDKAFATVPIRSGLLLAYATAEGFTAPDDGAFSKALAAELVKPGQEHFEAFRNASRAVGRTRATERLPWFSDQVDAGIVFAGSVAPPLPQPDSEALFWQSAKSCADFEAYLAQYPRGKFVALARNRLNDAPCKPVAVVPVPVTVSRPAEPQRWVDARNTPASTRAPLVSDPSALPDFALFRECEGCPEMVVIPAGSFSMGSPASEAGRYEDEDSKAGAGGGQIRVSLRRFAISRFETNWDEWSACVSAGVCSQGPVDKAGGDNGWGRDRRPVIEVDWTDAGVFARWVNGRASVSAYRRPTEAEWEYAARGGTTTRWSFGDAENQLGTYAWFSSNSGDRTQLVGGKAANPWGLYDMHGNVWEWVEDCYRDNLSGQTAAANTIQGCSDRVFRGGSWYFDPAFLRSAFRFRNSPSLRLYYLGFRVARTLN